MSRKYYVNPRLAVNPIGKAARDQHMKPLSPEDEQWAARVREIHNPIGNWANAMLYKGLTRAEVLETLDLLVAEIRAIK